MKKIILFLGSILFVAFACGMEKFVLVTVPGTTIPQITVGMQSCTAKRNDNRLVRYFPKEKKLADIEVKLGYNFINNSQIHAMEKSDIASHRQLSARLLAILDAQNKIVD